MEREVPGHDPHPAPARPHPEHTRDGGKAGWTRPMVPRRGRVRVARGRLRHRRYRCGTHTTTRDASFNILNNKKVKTTEGIVSIFILILILLIPEMRVGRCLRRFFSFPCSEGYSFCWFRVRGLSEHQRKQQQATPPTPNHHENLPLTRSEVRLRLRGRRGLRSIRPHLQDRGSAGANERFHRRGGGVGQEKKNRHEGEARL